jgi:hypothetical protein
MVLPSGLTAGPIVSAFIARAEIQTPISKWIGCQEKEKLMRATWKIFAVVALWATSWHVGLAQEAPPTILEIELENRVQYVDDISDFSKLASDPNVTPTVPLKTFVPVLIIADIVAVNTQPVIGTAVFHLRQINLRTAPIAGQAIADVVRNNVVDIRFEVLKSDGTPIGTIMASGMGGGPPPPGAPSGVLVGNVAIVGGTGAFLGVRGQVGQGMIFRADRIASMSEDPANRRRNCSHPFPPCGRVLYVLQLIPLVHPDVF